MPRRRCALPRHHRRAGLADHLRREVRRRLRGRGTPAVAGRRADVHDRRDRRPALPRDAGPGHPRHRSVLGRQPDHRVDADDPGQRGAVEGLLPRAERLPGVGPRGRALPAGHPRPARARAGPALGRYVPPGLVQARPARGQLQGARRRLQQAADARRATDRGGRHRGHQGHGPRRPLRRPHGDGRPGHEPDAAAREPARQQVAGLRARLRTARPGALRHPRQQQLQADRSAPGVRRVLAAPAEAAAGRLRERLPGVRAPRAARARCERSVWSRSRS